MSCEQKGGTLECATPTPRSALVEDGPLCDPLAEYLYDPANCDSGYFCGCSSSNPDDCYPSNDANATNWGGHYTTNDANGNPVVLTGMFAEVSSECPPGYYCPGRNDPERCIDLCEPKKVCRTPATMEDCPKDGFCPVASTEPQECVGIEQCTSEGLRRFEVYSGMTVIAIVIIVAIAYLYVGRYFVIRNARKQHKTIASEDDDEASEKAPLEQDGTNTEEGPLEQDGDKTEEGSTRRNTDTGRVSIAEPVVEVTNEGKKAPLFSLTDTAKAIINKRDSFGRASRHQSIVTRPEATVDIEFDKLRLSVPGAGTIMRGVSGSLKAGQLTAIMGPSGAGKTTFLTLMAGKIDRTSGTIKVNGEEKELTSMRRIIGFVPQEDVMLRELSVEENICHSALMRLPREWPHQKKLDLVEETLETLEIEHVRDSVVGDEKRRGVSGGQRKRVNIGLEMVAKPSLLCLDEPTSGLDSTTSLSVLRALKDMTESGANVVAVLHQPKYEIFKLFDQVLLLGQGGMTVYQGPADGMVDYFEKRGFSCPERENPADYCMDVLSGIVPHATNPDFEKDDLFEEWICAEENPNAISREEAKAQMDQERQAKLAEKKEQSLAAKKNWFAKMPAAIGRYFSNLGKHLMREFNPELKMTRVTPGCFMQSWLLFKRTCLQRLRNPAPTVINIVLLALAGGILPSLVPSDALLYVGIPKSFNHTNTGQEAYLRQNVKPVDEIAGILINVYLFLIIVSCLSVNVLGQERTVFFRDSSSGQLVLSYWFAKTIETLIWIPLYAGAFVLLGYTSEAWLLQPLKQFWAIIVFDLVGLYGVGMLTSLLVGPRSQSLVALVLSIIFVILFSGSVSEYGDESPGYQKFMQLWFWFWSTQGICVNEYEHYSYAFDIEALNAETPDNTSTDFGLGESAVGAGVGWGFDLSYSISQNIGFCALTAFMWHLFVLWTLKIKDHKKQR